jgi:putative ABC transport system permease protein
MRAWSRLIWRLRHGWRRDALERELAEEVRVHLELLEDQQLRSGVPEAEARQAARREFGNVGMLMEASRSPWGWQVLESFLHDLRFALRAFRRDWTSTTAAVTALALGSGLAIAIFTIVNAVLLRPLPYRDPDRLVMIWAVNKQLSWDQEKISAPEMVEWQRSGLFESVVGFMPNMTAITGPGEPVFTHGYQVTPGFLNLLGMQPMLGRAFSADEERKGGDHKVLLLRHSFWLRRFGGDPGVIGQKILVQNEPYRIVGVMGPDFQFFNRQTDVYVPTGIHPEDIRGRGRMFRLIGRLKPGITLAEAQARADAMSARFAQEFPESSRGWTVNLVPVPLDTTGPVRPALWVLLAGVAMVLLIACANVANLLLAQGIARSHELALRMALGAGRARVLRQLFTESLLLAAASGLLGYGLAHLGVRYLRSTLPQQYSFGRMLIQLERIQIDSWVAIFAAVVVPLAAVLIGVAPAWHASRPGLVEAFRDGARTSGTRGARRLQNLLVAGELALSVVLVVGAALLAQSFVALYQKGPGFQSAGLKSMFINLPTFEFRNNEEWQHRFPPLWQRTMTTVAQAPGIEAVAGVSHLPLAGFYYLTDIEIEGYNASPGNSPQAIDRYVSNSYHETMQVPLRQGRYFHASDRLDGPRVVLVNEQFAKRYFAAGKAVGRRMRYRGANQPWYEIAGVTGGEPAGGMDEEPKPMVYFSMDQSAWEFFHLIVRSRMDLDATVNTVKQALHKISPTIAPYEIRALDTMVLDSTWRVRYSMMLLIALSLVALALAALGVYSVMRYAVCRRTREIGIRMALGAGRQSILRMVLREGLAVAGAGVLAGIAGACLLTRFLSTLLFGVRAIEPVTFAAVCGFLLIVAAASCCAPALRAAALAPLDALRQE